MQSELNETPGAAVAIGVHRTIVVIGAGTMGSGIAEVAAAAGHPVLLCDTTPAAVERGLGMIRKSLDRRVERGRLTAEARDTILGRVRQKQSDEELREAGLVIEAIYENLDAKTAAFKLMEPFLAEDAILATNTSSLSVTALAAKLGRPERVVGMHFFNPAPQLPLVEVVSGHATDPAVAQAIVETSRAWGKTPVACKSTPGFIVNRVARPFYGEGLRLLSEKALAPATLDAVMREAGGFRMGPCELMDLIGHDINFAVTNSVYNAFFQDARYRPSLVQQDLVDAGWLGRKSKRGFFDYRDGAVKAEPEETTSAAMPASVVLPSGANAMTQALCGLLRESIPGLPAQPAGQKDDIVRIDGLALAITDGRTATQRSADLGEPVVLIDWAFDWRTCQRVAIALPAQAGARHAQAAIALLSALGKRVSLIADLPGMAVARTVAMLVNEAMDAAQQGVASPDDIDAAMKLGVNYPIGPFAWGRQIGLGKVLEVLDHLTQAYGEDRYRASIRLRREASSTPA